MMLRFYELSDSFTKLGFCTASIANGFFLYLTIFHIRRITGTYKLMVVTFAILGITFSGWELIARPFVHNFNNGFMFFSLNDWIGLGHQKFLQFSLAVYAGFYAVVVAFIAVQFLFRMASLSRNSKFSKKFDGLGVVAWVAYSLGIGAVYGGCLFTFTASDEYSDNYFEEEILKIYQLSIKEVPRFIAMPYGPHGSFRWLNLSFLIIGSLIFGLQYLIILYCGIQMRQQIKKELRNFSALHQKLQKQFFKALVVQTLVPTVLFIFPAMPVLLTPLLNIEISVQSGGMYALLSLYPPIDTLAFMIIVSEYRKVIKELWRNLFAKREAVDISMVSKANVA